jgi:gas vesicle protein
MSNKNRGGAFIAGMLMGGVLGVLTGVLIAPRSGRETRRILKKSAAALPELVEDLSTTMQLHAEHMSESAQRNWSDTLARLKEAIAAGIEASQLENPNPESQPSREQGTGDREQATGKSKIL